MAVASVEAPCSVEYSRCRPHATNQHGRNLAELAAPCQGVACPAIGGGKGSLFHGVQNETGPQPLSNQVRKRPVEVWMWYGLSRHGEPRLSKGIEVA